ncbi:MAG: hypothetical protein H7Z75_00965 [Ferruginibacter sp.]|nr:hypothetical protein [Cytophagales bacterium]
MQPNKIELRQTRDFGEVISATFDFIRQNLRKLLLCVLYLGGPFALVGALSLGFYQSQTFLNSGAIFSANSLVSLGVYFLVVLTASVVVTATVCYFMLLYRAGEEFEVGDVWRLVKQDFWMLLLTSIGFTLLCIPAFLFCFFPGVYVSVALFPIFTIRLVERIGFWEAVRRSFQLVSGRWWPTFGILIVTAMIQGMIALVVVLPFLIAMGVMGILSVQSGETPAGGTFALLYTIANSLQVVVSLVCGSIVVVALAFQYFSLVEEKEGVGLRQRIGTLGTQPSPPEREEEDENY